MKIQNPPCPLARTLVAVATAALSCSVATAAPYASCLTNNAGVVSFRLNATTATNDTVLVISSGTSVTNQLQLPGDNPANVLPRGLLVTNLGIAAGTFKVQIIHVGSGQAITNSPIVAVGSPRGLAVNTRATSPYFGWVYMSNSATNTSSRGDGLFAFTADLTDILGQGLVPRNGGYTGFGSSTAYSPYRISVAPDDSILVCDASDVTGNLIAMDPLLGSYQYVLQQISGASTLPVGSANNHGSIFSAVIVGTGSSAVLYTMDEDYQTDPTSNTATEQNSVWQYNIGTGPLPWGNAPVTKLMTPNIHNLGNNFQQAEQVVAGPSGYLYATQRRSNPGQYGLYIVDPAHPIEPSTYTPNQGGYFWSSQAESQAEGWTDDIFREAGGVAVSPDGRWLALLHYGAPPNLTNTVTGEIRAAAANDVILCPLTNGVPNLPLRVRITGLLGAVSAGRGVAFDAANNLYVVSSGQSLLQQIDIGESATATTGSDGTFSMQVPSTVVSVAATTPLAYEQGTVPGVFTITRSADAVASPLTVSYALSGTATNGVDYVLTTNRVTFKPGDLTTNITITPIDDAIPELTETVILALSGGNGYSVSAPTSAEIDIVDNETPQLRIMSASATMFEGNAYDYIRLSLRRYGNTNQQVVLDTTNFAFTGTAVSNVDYYLTNLPMVLDYGQVNTNLMVLYPIDNSVVDGERTINLTMLAGAGFTVTSNTATATIVDDDVPPETVLFAENFNNPDYLTNWVVYFASTNGAPDDYTVEFGRDYSWDGIPSAPHSAGDTHGLYLTVNKGDLTPAAAGLNLYPILSKYNPALTGFRGNYVMRFDMFLIENYSGSATVGTTEYALFGINHDGTHTNWFRNSTGGVPVGWTFDGLFYEVEADAAALGDYTLNSGPNAANNPTAVAPGRLASTLEQTFKSPPWTPGAGTGGSPANQSGSTLPCWAQVEVSQINGVVSLKINNTPILSYSNATAYTSGNLMLGYVDAYDSIGVAGAAVIYDNLRVVTASTLAITKVQQVGANMQMDFTWGQNDPASAFKLQSATAVTGPYADDNSATITVQTPASLFRATTATNGAARFYRIKHQ